MNQNKCLFEYCNFDNPYLKLYIFQNNNKTFNEITLDLNQYKLDNGVIENIDEIVNVLKKEMNKLGISALPKASLLLRCRKVYHDTLILPIKNHLQALYLYNKDIKSKTNKQDYYTVKNHYRYGDR